MSDDSLKLLYFYECLREQRMIIFLQQHTVMKKVLTVKIFLDCYVARLKSCFYTHLPLIPPPHIRSIHNFVYSFRSSTDKYINIISVYSNLVYSSWCTICVYMGLCKKRFLLFTLDFWFVKDSVKRCEREICIFTVVLIVVNNRN